MWLALVVACGGDGGAAAAVAPEPSPFCAAFEACVESLPTWSAGCERYWAGDPDCDGLDFSEGPSDWVTQTRRGFGALGRPGVGGAVEVAPDLGAKPGLEKKGGTDAAK